MTFTRFFAGFAIIALLAACSHEYVQNPDPNHTHADFAVWIRGEQVDFSDSKYMSGLSDDEETHDEEHEHLHPYMHLHDNNGSVMHRHKPGLSIGEFFASLGFTLEPACITTDTGEKYCDSETEKWVMLVNGVQGPLYPEYPFDDMDQILLSFGADEAELTRELDHMTNEACLYSRTCPWRGDPPTENCIADPAVPCIAPEEGEIGDL